MKRPKRSPRFCRRITKPVQTGELCGVRWEAHEFAENQVARLVLAAREPSPQVTVVTLQTRCLVGQHVKVALVQRCQQVERNFRVIGLSQADSWAEKKLSDELGEPGG